MSRHKHRWQRVEVLTEVTAFWSLRIYAWVCEDCRETGYALDR